MSALPALPRPPSPLALLPTRMRARLFERIAAVRIPDFTVPATMAKIAARLPQQPPTQVLTSALNFALDRILPRATLEPLRGRHLQMCVADAGLTLDFTLGAQGFERAAHRGKADLVISASTRDYLALALREEDPDTLFFSRRLRMEGDTDLGLLVKNTLDAVDWEPLKAKLLGTGTSG